MNGRSQRHKEILQILDRRIVRTQGELRRRLLSRGIRVNQATLSRDVRQLGLVKVPHGEGVRYAPLEEVSPPAGRPGDSLLARLARGVEVVGNLIVVKTDPGGASPLAISVDRQKWPEVAGTVAGDDTVLVVARQVSGARKVARKIEGLGK